MSNTDKNRISFFDYMAGAMLATGFAWIWSLVLTIFSDLFSSIAPNILVLVSYIIYGGGSTIASYIVCRKTVSGYLQTALRLAILSWVFSLLIASPSTLGTIVVLLICYVIGTTGGAYLALRNNLISNI